ncbi:MAG: Fe-S cluster domain-containing protein, partial [Nanoarchaeota archaeon]|nr:Fe-S cluster domain-containing protein [Nanoarchaeota archaeon]
MTIEIIPSIAVLGGFGLAFGLFLGFASKKFKVKEDPNVRKIQDVLPGINCGACGYAGCSAYAEAVVNNKEVPINLCVPGKEAVAKKIGEILCRECASVREARVARLHCAGGKQEVKNKYKYDGIKTCKSASALQGGPKDCSFGCIGFGDCVAACPFDAIHMGDNGLPVVDEKKCVACGKCVAACPKRLFELVPKKSKVHVLCSSKDKAPQVIKSCKVGCIACKRCETVCPVEGKAIHVIDNLAVMDYSKCISCGKCAEVCPR